VVTQLLQSDERLELGGKSQVLTVLFSDIRNFTTISEQLSAKEVVEMLNTYFERACAVVLAQGGSIDKFIGDAIMVEFGSPLPLQDHALRAAKAAIALQAVAREFGGWMEKRFPGRHLPHFAVGVGLHSGEAVIGNMGSNQRFNYTFLGDAGNLAARLEGINKQFGTFLMISQNTRRAIGNAFPVRELSRVRVVGKAEPITIFEPMRPEAAEARREKLAAFQTALETYYAGDFAGAQTRFAAIADDPVAAIYAKRCATLAATPPATWDGIWSIGEK